MTTSSTDTSIMSEGVPKPPMLIALSEIMFPPAWLAGAARSGGGMGGGGDGIVTGGEVGTGDGDGVGDVAGVCVAVMIAVGVGVRVGVYVGVTVAFEQLLGWPEQLKSVSKAHVEEHPSPSVIFPSSQASAPTINPSPHSFAPSGIQ